MKLNISLDALNLSTSGYIEQNLLDAELPECLGQMFLPTISEEPKIDVDVILKESKAVSEHNKVNVDFNLLFGRNDQEYVAGKVLPKEGLERITEQVHSSAKEYSDKVIKCASCKHTDLCYKLSFLYLEKLKFKYTVK